MKLWVFAYASGAIVVVWANGIEEARGLALAELADKAPGETQTETAAIPYDPPAAAAVVFSQTFGRKT